MKENPYFWLRSFALGSLPTYLLEQPNEFFEAAKKGLGSQYLFSLAEQYALLNRKENPIRRCIQVDYSNRYQGLEAMFLNVFPCLKLGIPPVHLAAVRTQGGILCRVFRLFYPSQGDLYLSELHLQETNPSLIGLPHYEKAVSLIFSYTLGTPFQPEAKITTLSTAESQNLLLKEASEAGAMP